MLNQIILYFGNDGSIEEVFNLFEHVENHEEGEYCILYDVQLFEEIKARMLRGFYEVLGAEVILFNIYLEYKRKSKEVKTLIL